MDSTSSCKDKVSHFRIKELKDVLTQLGLPKQGKKQDLVDRILALFSDEHVSKSNGWSKKYSLEKENVAKVIEDTYRKMQDPGATDLASRNHGSSDFANSRASEEKKDPFRETKVRCPCGTSLTNDSMIQCEDPKCQIWQHISCIIIPDKPMDGIQPETPRTFYCELCRLSRADPFLVAIGHPLSPLKLAPSNIQADGVAVAQTIEKTFQLSRTDKELLQRAEYDLQVWCILLNDKVSFRMQWPQYTELLVNSVPVRTTNRPGSQLLGINGRDDGPLITTCSREGTNKIILSRSDARVFSFGVRIVRKRSVQQVLSLIPSESAGEQFEDSLARVSRCLGGGAALENADSDSDVELADDSITVNLRCPMSGSRMKIAGRFKPCAHMGCFDLESFVGLNQRSRKWQCPICLTNYSLENVIIDPYFNRITTLLRNCGEDVTEIDVKPDGSWRVKNEERELGCWHLPDGSLATVPKTEVKLEPDILDQMKQADIHTGLKLGIKKNQNGIWQVSKPEDINGQSSGSQFDGKYGTNGPKIIPMSSSASESYRDGEDLSVNQDEMCFDSSLNNKPHELESARRGLDHAYNDGVRMAGPVEADVIVLTDSDDENEVLVGNTAYNHQGTDNIEIPFVPHCEDHGVGTGGIGLFGDGGDFVIPSSWEECPQSGSGFQLLSADAGVPDNFLDLQQNPLASADGNNYGLTQASLGNPSEVDHAPSYPAGTDIHGGLVYNPMASEKDPSLQIFLPTQPGGVELQADLHGHVSTSTGLSTDDWVSLRLGGAGMNVSDAAYEGHTNANGPLPSTNIQMDPLNDEAALLLSMNDDYRHNKKFLRSERSESPFSAHQQLRSVKQKVFFSILDSDSE